MLSNLTISNNFSCYVCFETINFTLTSWFVLSRLCTTSFASILFIDFYLLVFVTPPTPVFSPQQQLFDNIVDLATSLYSCYTKQMSTSSWASQLSLWTTWLSHCPESERSNEANVFLISSPTLSFSPVVDQLEILPLFACFLSPQRLGHEVFLIDLLWNLPPVKVSLY